jgi:hypothetical protein
VKRETSAGKFRTKYKEGVGDKVKYEGKSLTNSINKHIHKRKQRKKSAHA